jgi:hypothetical protein
MVSEPVSVEVYSSYTYAVEPKAFSIGGTRREIRSVVRRWRTPGWIHFLANTDDERAVQLSYDEQHDTWMLGK